MYLKYFIILFIVLFLSIIPVNADETIRAENNAYRHNNLGLLYLEEKYYFGAIKEFQIAIDLVPDKQASAAYYVNLGKTYDKIGYPALAQPCFEKAVNLNVLCFDYYLILAENYQKQGLTDEKLADFQSRKPYPLNDIMIGLLFIQKGDVATGMTVLDEFCNHEPNLLVTAGVRNYLDKLAKEKL
ncbi:hypothetical protein IJ182_01420 [bacterium]|nr:hypothetical protein [bacterium]